MARVVPALFALLAALLLVVACDDAEGEPLPLPTGGTTATVAPTLAPTVDSPTAAPSAHPSGPSTGPLTEPMTPIPPATPTEPVASTYFIATDDLPVVQFVPTNVEFPVEVPPRTEYSVGLSGREELSGRGMLFAFMGDGIRPGFWMLNTHIDLDIAFADATGEILHITTMLADTQDVHHPGQDYDIAIEAPAGWFAANSIEVGHTVEYLFDLDDLLDE